ncbi:MAG: DUF5716 family protein [Lachnospiraceae bacterium]
MILKKRIPNEFYKLFSTKNRDYYMEFLVAIYDENSENYTTLGLTEEECKFIVNEHMTKLGVEWEEEEEEDKEIMELGVSASGIVLRFVKWGWMKKDYDDKLNAYILSFPEYSQLYVELFKKMQKDDDSQERESILTIYTSLYTYHLDEDKNNDILKNAVHTSQSLGQLLSNMQDGMRGYFDELSKQKEFIEIQKVLIEEINNNDSKKYQILTTTDSFYRYKEAVKELVCKILNANDEQRSILEQRKASLEQNSNSYLRNQYEIEWNEEAMNLVCQIEREFDLIEKKYNKLIEQKTIFASRASARIRYILQEGNQEEDKMIAFINLLDRSKKREEIMKDFIDKMQFSAPFRSITTGSFFRKREREKGEFEPRPMVQEEKQEMVLDDFVPKPLYTRREIVEFIKQNSVNNVFQTTQETVVTIEDLEKLFFVWQRMTASGQDAGEIEIKGEIQTESGFSFSQLISKERK